MTYEGHCRGTDLITDTDLSEGSGSDSKQVKAGYGIVWALTVEKGGSAKVWALYNGDPATGTLILKLPIPGASVGFQMPFPFGLHFKDSIWVTAASGTGSGIALVYS